MGGDLDKIQKGCGVMNTKEISGKRQMEFLAGFDFVREAGTAGEDQGYFGQLRSEESDGGV